MEHEESLKVALKAAGESVISVARTCTVPILRGTPDDGELAGSGVLLQIADQPFLVTAAHVIWDGTQGVQSLAIGTPRGNVNLSDAKAVRSTPVAERHADDVVDAGFILLDEEHRSQLLVAGHSFLRNDAVTRHYVANSPLGELLWLYGYPTQRRIKDVAAKTLDVTGTVQWMMMTDGTGRVTRFDPQRMLAASYPEPSADGLSGAPDPDGMSGGGVWSTVQRNSETPTAAHVRIIGIQNSLNRPTLLARSTRMSVIYSMILEKLPELRAALALVTDITDVYPHVEKLGLVDFRVAAARP